MKKYIVGLGIISVLFLTPVLSLSVAYAAPIVPKCNTGPLVDGAPLYNTDGTPMVDKNNKPIHDKVYEHPCDFSYVMTLIQNIMDFLLKYLATPLAAIALCYAGVLMIFSGGSSEKLTKAKAIIKNVIIGYIIALAAWLIVKTIFATLGFKGNTFLK